MVEGKEFFDGDRHHGYGGFNYHPRFWADVILDIAKHYSLTKDSKVLDIGCAKGFMLYDFKVAIPNIIVRGIDISKYAIENAKKEIKNFVSVGDAKNLNGLKLPKSSIVLFPVIVIWIFVFFSSSAKWLKIATIIIGAILYIIAGWIFKGKHFDIGKHFIKRRFSILFVLLSILGCLFLVYDYLGEYNAKRLAQGLSGNKIKFDYTEKLNLPNELYLISYSKNKYFVCSKITDGSKLKVFAIDNSKITKVEIVQ